MHVMKLYDVSMMNEVEKWLDIAENLARKIDTDLCDLLGNDSNLDAYYTMLAIQNARNALHIGEQPMMKIFRKSEEVVGAVVDTVDHAISPESPLLDIPDTTGEHRSSLGDDFNLVLLVKEHGGRRKRQLAARRETLLGELGKLDKELLELDVLLNAVSQLDA